MHTKGLNQSAKEDARLAEKVKTGDEEAFQLLFDKHANWVYSKTYKMLGNHQDTEEVWQDIFVKVWQKIDKWNSNKGSFQAWLNQVARNTIIDAIRRRNRDQETLVVMDEDDMPLYDYVDTRPTPEEQAEYNEIQDNINYALMQVSKLDHRIAWALRHLEGLSIADISQTLNRKEGTVKVWIFRCTRELRKILVRQGIRLAN